jgi:hypothetical protein
MKSIPKPYAPTAEQIALQADKGRDVSRHFTNKGRMMPAIQRVNVDFTETMLSELDDLVRELNVSRQAVIKLFLRQALDQHHLAQEKRHVGAGLGLLVSEKR